MTTNVKQSPAATEMSAAGLKFLESLKPDQRAKASFGYGDAERLFWCHAPVNQRGVTLNGMDEQQRGLAYTLMATGLTEEACRWSTIMSVVNRSGKMSVHERIDIDPERTGKAPSAQRYPGRSDISG